jgi:hypothetical protein
LEASLKHLSALYKTSAESQKPSIALQRSEQLGKGSRTLAKETYLLDDTHSISAMALPQHMTSPASTMDSMYLGVAGSKLDGLQVPQPDAAETARYQSVQAMNSQLLQQPMQYRLADAPPRDQFIRVHTQQKWYAPAV